MEVIVFSEYAPPDENMGYEVSIYNEDSNYNAQINIDGFQTITRLQAKVIGDENSIKLVFEKYLPDNIFEPFNKGDLLLRFDKKKSKLTTFWGGLQPMLERNNESGKVYFEYSK